MLYLVTNEATWLGVGGPMDDLFGRASYYTNVRKANDHAKALSRRNNGLPFVVCRVTEENRYGRLG